MAVLHDLTAIYVKCGLLILFLKSGNKQKQEKVSLKVDTLPKTTNVEGESTLIVYF